ncbi:MAG: branched chain amino acid aminotransferase [Patescibacteria group bacterium]|nr:MAG: branched chain amino acid aminotransferase [Patescibacteria group bacterium]
MGIRINSVEDERVHLPDNLNAVKFGSVFTRRMYLQQYMAEKGWHAAVIGLWADVWPQLGPEASVFHYGQEIFEGLKAYRRPDGNLNLFRHYDNVRRFNRSAERMAMQEVNEQDHAEAIETLVKLEHEWVPNQPGTALYIRPTQIATETAIGVVESSSYLHYVILSPVGPYFPSGFKPMGILVEPKYRRAVVGGTGEAKTGGNYAASMIAGREAKKKGFFQVLWLDGQEGKYVEEAGAMNVCFVYGKTIVTPALSGSILHGITRDSILKLAPQLGYEVEESKIPLERMLVDVENGTIAESFACGTAATIAPIGKFGYKDKEYVVNNGTIGPVTHRLYTTLTNIQYGLEQPPFPDWIKVLEVEKSNRKK